MLLLPSCRLTFPLSALICAASIMAQEGRTGSKLLAKQESNSTRATSPCFDTPDSAMGKQRENEAIARLPKLALFWLTEDVAFIISPEERCAFLHLATDEERDHFIEQFWCRRAPDTKSLDNSFKREHYERIIIANQKLSDQTPGWKTDRGRVYVTFGPPGSIESHQSGEKTGRQPEEGNETVQYSWEAWHYNDIEGLGEDVEFAFVDPSESGDYRIVRQPEMGDELTPIRPYNVGRPVHREGTTQPAQTTEIHIGPVPAPIVQFKDLEAMVVSRIIREQVKFTHRIEFAKATRATTFTEISVGLPSNQPSPLNNTAKSPMEFEVFGRVSKPSGWVVDTFERKFSLAAKNDSGRFQRDTEFQLALAPGTYHLAIVVKDLASGNTGTLFSTFDVPPFDKVQRSH
jgi:GWxTD domain-containing protein